MPQNMDMKSAKFFINLIVSPELSLFSLDLAALIGTVTMDRIKKTKAIKTRVLFISPV
jgi:hypothetical protein